MMGRVPHQISPSGQVAFAGNAQETPQWVSSLWDAYRWTGDSAFLADLYPAARKGLFDYVLGTIDPDGDGYPSGPGMVEAEGMGAEKLDSAAYTWAALHALAKMAALLGDVSTLGSSTAGCRTHRRQFRSRLVG
jgi:glycogen debranching enzyme